MSLTNSLVRFCLLFGCDDGTVCCGGGVLRLRCTASRSTVLTMRNTFISNCFLFCVLDGKERYVLCFMILEHTVSGRTRDATKLDESLFKIADKLNWPFEWTLDAVFSLSIKFDQYSTVYSVNLTQWILLGCGREEKHRINCHLMVYLLWNHMEQ